MQSFQEVRSALGHIPFQVRESRESPTNVEAFIRKAMLSLLPSIVLRVSVKTGRSWQTARQTQGAREARDVGQIWLTATVLLVGGTYRGRELNTVSCLIFMNR